jgi:phasin family protein
MSSISEKFANATKEHFEAQFALIDALTGKFFEDTKKIIELNVNATKTSLEEMSDTMKQMGAVSEPQEVVSMVEESAQPDAESTLEYGRKLVEIATDVQAEFAQTAERQVAETTRVLADLIEETSRSATPGSEHMIETMTTVIGSANTVFEQLAKNAKEALETLQTTMQTATDQIAHTMEKIHE